jgi:hypothetical protein
MNGTCIAGLAGIVAATILASAVARAQGADQLYALAQAEKTLVFYSGGPAEPYERMA